MFNKIYDWFDNALDYGFHRVTTKKQTVNPDSAMFVMAQALDIWRLWVKQHVTFTLSSEFNNQHEGSACYSFRKAIIQARSIYVCKDAIKKKLMQEPDVPLCDDIITLRKELSKKFDELTSAGVVANNKEKKGYAEQISIPYSIMSGAEDFASAIDCVTAAGLEALEFNNSTLFKLTRRCVQALVDNTHPTVDHYDLGEGKDIEDLAKVSLNLPKTEQYHLHCNMFKKVWSALCTQQHRNTILDKWPGWSDLFICLDATYLDSHATVQRFVDGKTFGNSEYERFLTAVCYNVCSTEKKIKLPKPPQFEMAASVVRRYWPELLKATPDNQIIELGKMLTEIRGILSLEVDPNKAPRKGEITSGRDQLEPYEGNTRVSESVMAEPSKSGGKEQEREGNKNWDIKAYYSTMEEALKLPKRERPGCVEPNHRSGDCRNQQLIDAVSAASWRVALPPPTDHGQNSGVLDEGALHKLAGWGDHHVFDQPPEQGAGQVVLAVLMDVSGSMAGRMDDTRSFLNAVMEGCKRHPNVKIIPIAYNGDKDFTLGGEPQYSIACMLEITNTDQLRNLWAHGGTPTGLVIKEAIRRLDMEDVAASKGIIVVTDGRPCGCSVTPGQKSIEPEGGWLTSQDALRSMSAIMWSDGSEVVLDVCRSSPYPVVGVGIGGGITRTMMIESFGPLRSFNVDSPAKVVPIVCDILDSATM